MPRKTDKRERLIQAAQLLIHQQGYHLTTLADIAQEADVPLGNVYYYFKTKRSIVEAVIANLLLNLKEKLQLFGQHADAYQCLTAFLQSFVEYSSVLASFGCQIGGLCQELSKEGGKLSEDAAGLLQTSIDWCQERFIQHGIEPALAATYAIQLEAYLQGMFLITATFKEPKHVKTLIAAFDQQLKLWLSKATTGAYTRTPVDAEMFA